VDLAYVAGDDELTGSTGMAIQKVRKERRRKLDEICDRLEAAGIRAESHVYVGDANDEIEMAARECQSTMIILGSSSKSAWVERWLGSTPLKIAENSVFPTLIIPPAKS
jgi:nucleotide-binding universal stress UspA family protein